MRIPTAPFCGELGVAPSGPARSTIPPTENGGNMDTRHLIDGSRLWLPVAVPDALFSLGDGHAAQGDGEVCGTAIETPVRVTVRLTIRRDMRVTAPEFETPGPLGASTNTAGWFATDGIGPDLFQAARDAVSRMIDRLGARSGLAAVDAYLLVSVAGDLRISEDRGPAQLAGQLLHADGHLRGLTGPEPTFSHPWRRPRVRRGAVPAARRAS